MSWWETIACVRQQSRRLLTDRNKTIRRSKAVAKLERGQGCVSGALREWHWPSVGPQRKRKR
ncbi:MAG TPA: hypothetical protein PKJ63_01385 [Cyclobacteriaceae bacterium]|nr:hypothetical protein [Cyclobacteriaceae bacterium]